MGKYDFDPTAYLDQLNKIIEYIQQDDEFNYKSLRKILTKYPKDDRGLFSKDELVAGYRTLLDKGLISEDPELLTKLRMKPTRSISGVTIVTVLTKPFPCPGHCIYCPNDVRMPKSYLSDEPGAQRAERNDFDPYLQTYNRLLALKNIGHNVNKIELIILGGTWSFYPEHYQIWFVKECFRAMNDFGIRDGRKDIQTKIITEEADRIPALGEDGRLRSYNEIMSLVEKQEGKRLLDPTESATWEELTKQHSQNEHALSRCVGLVIETRPDYIDEEEAVRLRRLGATKIQIGIQTLDDEIQTLNMRGHGRKETENAIKILRLAGFKIHGHWMPNLHGSTVEKDIRDYQRLWESEISPDELKIYPTSIIEHTELFELYKRGKYLPYSYDELLSVLTSIMPKTPRYCRLTRVVRDIPSPDIVAGNKLTNFRQIVEEQLKKDGNPCQCIRCREIKETTIRAKDLEKEVIEYTTPVSREFFLSFRTKDTDKITGFLRLSLPTVKNFQTELEGESMIREIHVYGQVVGIGTRSEGRPQHLGQGSSLIELAKGISKKAGYDGMAVISSIGTREYYRKKGFENGELYQHMRF